MLVLQKVDEVDRKEPKFTSMGSVVKIRFRSLNTMLRMKVALEGVAKVEKAANKLQPNVFEP